MKKDCAMLRMTTVSSLPVIRMYAMVSIPIGKSSRNAAKTLLYAILSAFFASSLLCKACMESLCIVFWCFDVVCYLLVLDRVIVSCRIVARLKLVLSPQPKPDDDSNFQIEADNGDLHTCTDMPLYVCILHRHVQGRPLRML